MPDPHATITTMIQKIQKLLPKEKEQVFFFAVKPESTFELKNKTRGTEIKCRIWKIISFFEFWWLELLILSLSIQEQTYKEKQ